MLHTVSIFQRVQLMGRALHNMTSEFVFYIFTFDISWALCPSGTLERALHISSFLWHHSREIDGCGRSDVSYIPQQWYIDCENWLTNTYNSILFYISDASSPFRDISQSGAYGRRDSILPCSGVSSLCAYNLAYHPFLQCLSTLCMHFTGWLSHFALQLHWFILS